jgi:uncharacterized protein YaiE (UPF0345 family)
LSPEPTQADPSDGTEDLEDYPDDRGPMKTVALPAAALVAVVALVVGLAGGFLIERSRVKGTHSSAAVTAAAPPTQNLTPKGTVTAVSATTITFQTNAGKSMTVTLTGSSVVLKGTPAHTSDIAAGQSIEIDAQAQPDGSLTAKRVVIVGS